MSKVIVTRPFMGICAMQVCAVKDATDEEILSVCNSDNPSGTSNGWSAVIREAEEGSMFKTKDQLPVQCRDDAERMHFVVLC
jgi:hypothetical protein